MPTEISTFLRRSYGGKRVLVTGHTGFKGAWLSLWLTELGAEVTGLSLASESPLGVFEATGLEKRMRSRLGDIRSSGDIEAAYAAAAPEVVFHLAAQPIVGASYQDPLATLDVNAMGTARVLDCARRRPETRAIVVVTSDKCYVNSEHLWGHRELDPLGGDDPYSASKACAELVAASYRASFFSGGRGPRLATARAGNVIGGGDWGEFRLIPVGIRDLIEGKPIPLRNPHHTRPFQFVLDALAGYLLVGAKLSSDDGELYASGWNFGPAGRARTVREAADAMVRDWGAGSIEHTRAELFTEKRLLKLDSTKSIELLGWQTALGFDDVIRWTTAWYKQQHQSGDGDMLAFSQQAIAQFEQQLAGAVRI